MKLLACLIFKSQGNPNERPLLLGRTADLTSFGYFTRSSIAEHILFASRTIVQRTNSGTRQSVGLDDNPFEVHTYVRSDLLCGVAVADKEYPGRVAYSLINQFLASFEAESHGRWKEEQKDVDVEPEWLTALLTKYQDPKSADKIMKIQNNLEEIKDIMHKNIDEVLQRGEKLDDLMDKAEDLSATSVTFYKQAKKTNQCCKMY